MQRVYGHALTNHTEDIPDVRDEDGEQQHKSKDEKTGKTVREPGEVSLSSE